MKHWLDLTTDELRALYIVIPHDQPCECLQETVAKIERFLEIAALSEQHAPAEQVWGSDAFRE